LGTGGFSAGKIKNTKVKTSMNYISLDNNVNSFVYESTIPIKNTVHGSALFNYDGEVVAINTMTWLQGTRELNYSIPARHFVRVADYIIKNGNNSFTKTHIDIEGKSIPDLSSSQKEAEGIKLGRGIYVTKSNIEGLEENVSVIIAVGEYDVHVFDDLEYALFISCQDKEEIDLTIIDKTGLNQTGTNLRVITVPLSR
jgi:S1-C subfamily serine protease